MENVMKHDQDRLKLFKKYGYDIPKARNFIISKARLRKGKILEVGTGRGHMAVALARKGFTLTSIDLDRKAQNAARANLRVNKLGKSVILKIMNAERIKFKDNSFDHVVSVNFIHHAKNPAQCLREMVRLTKDTLVVADINKRGERIMKKVHGLDGHDHAESKMSLQGIKAFLDRAGLCTRAYRDSCQTVIIAKKTPGLAPELTG